MTSRAANIRRKVRAELTNREDVKITLPRVRILETKEKDDG